MKLQPARSGEEDIGATLYAGSFWIWRAQVSTAPFTSEPKFGSAPSVLAIVRLIASVLSALFTNPPVSIMAHWTMHCRGCRTQKVREEHERKKVLLGVTYTTLRTGNAWGGHLAGFGVLSPTLLHYGIVDRFRDLAAILGCDCRGLEAGRIRCWWLRRDLKGEKRRAYTSPESESKMSVTVSLTKPTMIEATNTDDSMVSGGMFRALGLVWYSSNFLGQ